MVGVAGSSPVMPKQLSVISNQLSVIRIDFKDRLLLDYYLILPDVLITHSFLNLSYY